MAPVPLPSSPFVGLKYICLSRSKVVVDTEAGKQHGRASARQQHQVLECIEIGASPTSCELPLHCQ